MSDSRLLGEESGSSPKSTRQHSSECAVAAMQQASLEAGTDRLSMKEIEAEIQAVRRERRERRTCM